MKKRIFDKNLLTVTTSLGSLHLVSLAAPILFEQICNNMIGTVSTAVLSGYSEEAVAATGVVNIFLTIFTVFFASIATGASVIISNLIGADLLEKAEKACWTAVVLCGSVGVVCTAILFLGSAKIVGWMQLSGTVFGLANTYLKIRALSLVLLALSTMMLAQMRCYGYSKVTVITGLVTNLCNLLFSVYAVRYATYPVFYGVSGVAVGSVLSQLIGLAIVIVIFKKLKIKVSREHKWIEFRSQSIKILKIGIPTCISNASFTLSQIITNSFAVLLGLNAVSGKVYFGNILCYAYLFSLSIGTANALMVGRLCGAGRFEHARKLNKMLVSVSIPVNLMISLLILICRDSILSLFTANEAIINMALGVFLVDILVEQARAVSHIYEYALRAAGDVTLTMIVTLLSCWLFSVGAAYFLSITCNLGLIGCWIGLAIDESIRAVFTYYRWRSEKWTLKVINKM